MEHSITQESKLTPWDVKGDIDYDKLVKEFGVQQLDISALPKNMWLPRLQEADIFFVEGGNTFHLMHWIEKSGLKELLPEMLKTKILLF